MSDVWRIFVIEGEESLNRSLVNALHKDGYVVQGSLDGTDAVQVIWSEAYDVVICDLKTPGAGGLELLQWLRASRPETRVIIIGSADSSLAREQALEGGAASYFEKPLDFRLLREELRRLLQQTGFSAELDSFDLLDIIQIVTMSRKGSALLVNTGIEERGILRFQNGELVWAEYGTLHGEEAFFALAAHKNGTVTQQLWNGQIAANVTQPLSRLIFQALQYRTKYAHGQQQQPTGEQKVNTTVPLFSEEDDSPFMFLSDAQMVPQVQNSFVGLSASQEHAVVGSNDGKQWWEDIEPTPHRENPLPAQKDAPMFTLDGYPPLSSTSEAPPSLQQNQPIELPDWLTDQPTASSLPVVRPASLSNSAQIPAVPVIKPSSPEWQTPLSALKMTEPISPKLMTGASQAVSMDHQSTPKQVSQSRSMRDLLSLSEVQENSPALSLGLSGLPPVGRRNYNYSALVSALQTLGYSIPGFVAAAVVSMDGSPIAQVAVDDLDITPMCKHWSSILQGVLQSLNQGMWGDYEDTVITSASRYILMRLVGGEKKAFQVLITTHEANCVASLEIMVQVEGAISAALQ